MFVCDGQDVPRRLSPLHKDILMTSISNALSLGSAILFLMACWVPYPIYLLHGAAALLVVSGIIAWRSIPAIGKGFAAIAAVAVTYLLSPFGPATTVLDKALTQGVGFATLLSILGVFRGIIHRVSLLRQTTNYLLTYPPAHQYRAIKLGSHFLSLLFNVGVIGVIADATRHVADGAPHYQRRALMLATMRGAALSTIWSPLGLGFAIAMASVQAVDPLELTAAMFLSAACILIATSLDYKADAESIPPHKPRETPILATVTLCIVCAILLGFALALHSWLTVSFTVATSMAVLTMILGFLSASVVTGKYNFRDAAAALETIGTMRAEGILYLSASLISVSMLTLLSDIGRGPIAFVNTLPYLLVLIGSLLAIVASSMSFLPHSIVIMFIGQLLGPSALGQQHALLFAMTLMFGWGIGIAVSPVSAMATLTASALGATPRMVALRWNKHFALKACLIATVILMATDCLGGR